MKEDLKKYWPISLILLAAVVTTAVAGWQTAVNPSLNTQDTWGFYLWFTPLGYLLLVWLFKRTGSLNRPMVALGAVLVYGLSILLLFSPVMPAGLKWHYVIGASALVFLFIGPSEKLEE